MVDPDRDPTLHEPAPSCNPVRPDRWNANVPDDVAAYERALRRAGLPLLIEDYSASEDVFTRAVPLLGLVFVVETLGAIDLAWPAWVNVLAALGGLALLLGAIALANVARGRRALAVPRSVGRVELAIFVLVPALLPVVFGGQLTSALVTALGNALLLALVYGVVGIGLFSIVRWTGARLAGQLTGSVVLLSRALPLLLVFSLVLFLTTEMWQVFGGIADAFLVVAALLLLGVGSVFLLAGLPREIEGLERTAGGDQPALKRLQRLNVGLVLFVGQALQVLVVTAAVGAFFVLFGLFTISREVYDAWLGGAPDTIRAFTLFGHEAILSAELLRVAGALAAFSGLYYVIAVLSDAGYREELMAELTGEVGETFALRREYLAARRGRCGQSTNRSIGTA
jgi:hypothetical protein